MEGGRRAKDWTKNEPKSHFHIFRTRYDHISGQPPANNPYMIAPMRGDTLTIVSGHDGAISELDIGGVAAVAPFGFVMVRRFLQIHEHLLVAPGLSLIARDFRPNGT
jgi:hypothetical protein